MTGLALRALLRALAALMLAVGIAATVASLVLWSSISEVRGWTQPVLAFGLRVAIVFLPGSIAALLLLPSAVPLQRRESAGEAGHLRGAVGVMLLVLGVVAAMHLPAVVGWWSQSMSLPDRLLGTQPDPLGFKFVVGTFATAPPLLLALAVFTFVLASLFERLAPSAVVFRILAVGTIVGCSYIYGAHTTLNASAQAVSALLSLPEAHSEPWVAALTKWSGQAVSVGGPLITRLSWVGLGYLFAMGLSRSLVPAPGAQQRAGEGLELAGSASQPTIPISSRSISQDVLGVAARPAHASEEIFSESMYALRPQSAWTATFLPWPVRRYEIRAIPSMAGQRFSFSRPNGLIRREPSGPDLFRVSPHARKGILLRQSYEVVEVATGRRLGLLIPDGLGWNIADEAGATIAVVERAWPVGSATRYVARIGDVEVCRFDWAMLGATILSAELGIEFMQPADSRFERALAVAVAPIIEQRVRREQQRAAST